MLPILPMRLTINIDDDLYSVAKSLATAKDHSISQAVNELIRRGLAPQNSAPRRKRNGLPVVRCEKTFTSEDVYEQEREKE